MDMQAALALWVSTFVAVFLLGFQSRNVNSGKLALAGCTSFLIATAQLVTVRGIVNGDPMTVLLVTGTSGPAGIMLSMVVFRRLFGRK